MKTEAELKKLAEFAADFLGMEHNEFGCVYGNELGWLNPCELDFFKAYKIAPILAHLAKREMEKRGFEIKYHSNKTGYRYSILKSESNKFDEWGWMGGIHEGKDENEYIALWSAIEEAMNG